MTVTLSERLKTLAKDLTQDFPSSPRRLVGGYVLAGRMIDKCRAVLNGTAGEYHFNCPLDQRFFQFTQINPDEIKAFIATGATDDEIGAWIEEHSKVTTREEIVKWNNSQRDMRLSEMPIEIQLYMEDYIAQYVPAGKVVYHFFDVFDYEEQRL